MSNSEIASNIKFICKQKKISVKTVLEECNINRNFIYDLEHKNSAPSYEKIEKIAHYLECSTDAILGKEPSYDKPIEEMEMQELLEHLAHREECRMLFSLAKGCTKEEILQTIKIIEALKK